MSNIQRKQALSAISGRGHENPGHAIGREMSISEIYGEDVFSLKVMKDYLPGDVFRKLRATISNGCTLDPTIADDVANAMKAWAVKKGASHYTHWFQPLTGSTAEKHDSFIEPDGVGGVIMKFSGRHLVQGESDASSFPSGGIRATFEARGYTAWDPTSPAFIKREDSGATLCIPTAFCSYTGEALDKKTPLMRSIQAVSEQAGRLLECFGEKPTGRVVPTLGAEQEYFLIDKAMYLARPDLMQTGRTIFGNVPPKHQQLEDHYFGSIKTRILNFMTEVDHNLWRLGIPAKTRHNEVAPAQFEIALVFEDLNLAVDHNMMVMEVLRKVADKHGLACLLHEKPFAGINGSGKHNNWSINPPGDNLLNPGEDARSDARFLTFLCAVIKAVDTHADLLRASVAGAGNDHRLGAHEAPPAIISIYLGEQLTEVLEGIGKGKARSSSPRGFMQIGVDTLPVMPLDSTDRNRTSPLAFTGNKFEFRAVGSNHSCAGPNIVLNTIVAEALDDICTKLEKVPKGRFNKDLQKLLAEIISKHKRVIFNGDNYSQAWIDEAHKRGLPNIRKSPEALNALLSDKAEKLFKKYKVLSEVELRSRHEVYLKNYCAVIKIEGELAADIATRMIFPVAVKQQKLLSDTLLNLRELGIKYGQPAIEKRLKKLGILIKSLSDSVEDMTAALEDNSTDDIIAVTEDIREAVDGLEKEVDDNLWPLPTYGEMLFIY
ncbi:MAG: glutamine synthetase III [Victivallales bacterium]|nr:glutamine synthetase III [Victivallales bacterium]